MIRFACAYCTAAHTCRNSASRSRTPSFCASHHAVIGAPSTYSITRYGRPSGVTPPSSSVAMLRCSRRARICRSRRNRATSRSDAPPRITSLIATRFRNCSSSRVASNTVPMPPVPSTRSSRYAPRCSPIRPESSKSSDVVRRLSVRKSCESAMSSSARTSRCTAGSSAASRSSVAARSPVGKSTNASKSARTRCSCAGSITRRRPSRH